VQAGVEGANRRFATGTPNPSLSEMDDVALLSVPLSPKRYKISFFFRKTLYYENKKPLIHYFLN
jgi:hypothetical protein